MLTMFTSFDILMLRYELVDWLYELAELFLVDYD